MNDDEAKVVRNNIERSDERQRERRFQLRRDFQMQGDLLDVVALARKVAIVGLVPSAIWIVRAANSTGVLTASTRGLLTAFGVVGGFVGLGIVYYFAPVVSGLAAHFWFGGSVVMTRRTAIALTLLIEASVFGWIVVITT